MSTAPPLWVRAICRVIDWVDNHPLYLLPSCTRYWRFDFYDLYCLCPSCEDRRKHGLQPETRRRRTK